MGNAPGVLISPEFDRFFRTHEKVMWQLSAIDFSKMQPELLTADEVEALRGAMLVESHNPVYTMRILEYYRPDHEVTSFVTTWGYEEMKHYAILRTYLEVSGRIDKAELANELDITRAGPWGDEETRFTKVQSFTYAMVQEQATARFYKRFAEYTKEPLLQEILRLISKDEYRHCQYYLDKGKQELSLGGERMREVDEVLLNFQMPGPTFVKDFDKFVEAGMKVAPIDVGAMRETADKVAQLTGRMHMLKLAADRTFHRKLSDEWGIDIRSVLSATMRTSGA
jgi:rubrerythrin